MTRKKETFGGLLDLRGTGNKELSGAEGQDPRELEVPSQESRVAPITDFATQQLLSARVPQVVKDRYDDLIVAARRSHPGLRRTELQVGVIALVQLLHKNPDLRQRWFDEIREVERERLRSQQSAYAQDE